MTKGMTDDELIAALEMEERDAVDFIAGTVAQERGRVIDYYFGRPFGNEEEGRSQVVSTDVLDVIEGMLPSILKPFVSSDDVCKFDPQGPEDDAAAEQETAYLNYILMRKNDGFGVIRKWVWDGLAQKNGIVKYWYDNVDDVQIERYQGLTDDGLTWIAQSNDVEIVEHSSYPAPVYGMGMQPPMQPMGALQVPQAPQGMPPPPMPTQGMPPQGMPAPPQQPPMLHDVVCRIRKTYGCAKVENVPPEEFLICRDAVDTNPKKARFVEHRRLITLSDLRRMGFDVPDDMDDSAPREDLLGEPEFMARHEDDQFYTSNPVVSGPTRQMLVRDMYPLIDYDGDGIAERRNVVMVGGHILRNEEVEEPPFSAWTPYIIPHRFFGMCPGEMAMDFQLVKSTLLRQMLDNAYTINNNRFGVSKRVNLDDLLNNVIGGAVRINADEIGNDIMPLPVQPIGGMLQPLIEYMDSEKENRTGFTRYSQGMDADSLNKTATGVSKIMQAAAERQELVARTFAETGLKDLLISLHGLLRRHATQPDTVRLTNTWVTVDPRQWRHRKDMSIAVGLGTGDRQQSIQNYMMILQAQQQWGAAGLVGPDQIHAAAKKLLNAVGEKNVEQFIKDPAEVQPQPPQPHPMVQAEQIKAQASMQTAQVKAQADQAIQQARAQADMQVQQHKIQTDAALEEARMRMQLQVDDLKHSREQQTQIEIAQIRAAAQVQAADVTATKQAVDSRYQQEMTQ